METFINISKAIHQEYHLGGDSALAKLVDQTLNEAVTSDEVCLKYFKTSLIFGSKFKKGYKT